MPSRAEIVSFDDSPPPPGADPWVVAGAGPGTGIDVADPDPGERDRYAAAKRRAASEANAAGEHVMQYNARKQQVIREIYHRAFAAAGLLEP
jgi:hypothetical protein